MRPVIIKPLCPHEKEKKDIKDIFELPLGGWKINRSFCLKVNKSRGYYNPTQLRIWWLIRRPLKKAKSCLRVYQGAMMIYKEEID